MGILGIVAFRCDYPTGMTGWGIKGVGVYYPYAPLSRVEHAFSDAYPHAHTGLPPARTRSFALCIRPMYKKASTVAIVVHPWLALGLTLVLARDAKVQCCTLDFCL